MVGLNVECWLVVLVSRGLHGFGEVGYCGIQLWLGFGDRTSGLVSLFVLDWGFWLDCRFSFWVQFGLGFCLLVAGLSLGFWF